MEHFHLFYIKPSTLSTSCYHGNEPQNLFWKDHLGSLPQFTCAPNLVADDILPDEDRPTNLCDFNNDIIKKSPPSRLNKLPRRRARGQGQ